MRTIVLLPLLTLLATPAVAELNLGLEEVVQAAGDSLVVTGYSVPSLVDWDEDGRPDLLVGEGGGTAPEGRVRIYLNEGTAAAPAFSVFQFAQADGAPLTVAASGCLGCFPRVVDWDADGRKDLLLGLADGRIMIFLNTGTDQEPVFDAGAFVTVGEPSHPVEIDVGNRATPSVCDWNGDGRADLVAGAYDGRIYAFLNDAVSGAPLFLTATFASTGSGDLVVPSGRSSPAVCDLDDDGRKDILSGDTHGRLFRFLNTGTDTEPLFADPGELVTADGLPIDLPDYARSRPAICDWTGDGYLDVLVGGGDGLVRLYQGVEPTIATPEVAAVPATRLRCWPNPANPRTTITFSVPRPQHALVTVVDLAGRRVVDLFDGVAGRDLVSVKWDGRDRAGREVGSGVYLVVIQGEVDRTSRRLTLVR